MPGAPDYESLSRVMARARAQLASQPQRMPTSYGAPQADSRAMAPETFDVTRAREGFANGGVPDDKPAFDPTKPFEPVAADSAAKPAFDPSKPFEPAPTVPAAPPPSILRDVASETAKGLVRGAGNFVGDLGEAAMGPFGPSHHAGNLIADLGLGERPAASPTYGQSLAHATNAEASPQTMPGKYASSISETLGNPASYFGPGGWLSKALMGAASGAGSEAAGEAAEGSGFEPAARLAGAFAAGPVAARVAKPQLAPAQQALADAGVTQMSPGQLTGGMLKSVEDKLTSVPILGDFIQNARGRSITSFNKAVANQALEPIGERLSPRTAVGHDTVSEVADKLGYAYDRLLPNLQFVPDRQYALDLNNILQNQVHMLPQQQIDQFQRILDAKLGPAVAVPAGTVIGTPGTPRAGFAPMTGEALKKAESDLSKRAQNYMGSADADQRDLGRSLSDVVKAMRANVERVNPQHAEELRNINSGWAMYARIRDAAAARKASEGVFTPSDLLGAVKKGDKSVAKGSFAKGDALMQDFAEAGQKVLPSKVPDSGTAGRTLASLAAAGSLGAGSGLGYVSPKILAGIGAATVPYMTPSMALLNRWVRPTTGVRAGYSNLGRGAGMARPLIQNDPFAASGANPYAP